MIPIHKVSIREAYTTGWNVFRAHWRLWLETAIPLMFMVLVLAVLTETSSGNQMLLKIATWIVAMLTSYISVAVSLLLLRDPNTSYKSLIRSLSLRHMLRFTLNGLVISVGLLVLVSLSYLLFVGVPALATGFQYLGSWISILCVIIITIFAGLFSIVYFAFLPYVAYDHRGSVWKAPWICWQLIRGSRTRIVMAMILAAALQIVGTMLAFIGLFIVTPVITIALARLYQQARGEVVVHSQK